MYTDMVQILYQNPTEKYSKMIHVDPPCAQTGVKSSFCTLKLLKYDQIQKVSNKKGVEMYADFICQIQFLNFTFGLIRCINST